MFLIVAIGVYPRPIFEQIQPAVHTVVENIQVQREQASADARAKRTPRRPAAGWRAEGRSAPPVRPASKDSGKAAPKASASDKTSKKGGQ